MLQFEARQEMRKMPWAQNQLSLGDNNSCGIIPIISKSYCC